MIFGKERTKAIKEMLKKEGYDIKNFSVKTDCTTSWVEIKNPLIDIKKITEITKGFEKYDCDIATGEILVGANEYIFVQYA